MPIVERHIENLNKATDLEKNLAAILQQTAFMNEPEQFQRLNPNVVAPLYLEQACVLSRNHALRNGIRLILDSNQFPVGEVQ